MSDDHAKNVSSPVKMPSLLDAETLPIAGPAVAPVPHGKGTALERAVVSQVKAGVARFRKDPELKWVRRVSATAGVLLVVLIGTWAATRLMPTPKPNFLDGDLGDVLEFALLSDDFNKLPLDERMRLLKDLVQRMKTMSADDAPIMAAFAAGIEKEMRRQLETNVKKLAADMIDEYAADYSTVPPEKASEYLDDAVIRFTELMEDVAGEKSPLPRDEKERLAVIKTQAKKDEERMREDTSKLTAGRAARFFEFVHKDDDAVSSPVQRGRTVRFMRDMTRHLRGQDPSTGKPLKGG